MARIGPEEVRELATLARLQLSEEEVARMAGDLAAILEYVDALRDLDTTDIEPMTHAVPFDCPLRVDEVKPSLSLEEALSNAPRREGSFFEVPRIVPMAGAPMAGAPAAGGTTAGGPTAGGSEDEP